MARIQQNILAVPERRLLDWLCVRLAGWLSPDQLTLIGLLGAVVVLVGYGLSSMQPDFLWLAVLGYVLHWFGDSLDGSMARYLKRERPRFGYFVDHSIDALGNSMIMLGLGLTSHVQMPVALFTLVGYLLMSIHVFLKQHVTGTFQLSFLVMGPTELRVILVALTLAMRYLPDAGIVAAGRFYSVYDLVLGAAGMIFVALFCWHTWTTARALKD